MSTAAAPIQFSYQFVTPITGAAHESWTLVGTVDTSFEITLDVNYALIVKVGNSGDMAANGDYQLQYQVGAAGWNNVSTTSTNVRTVTSGDSDQAVSDIERLTTSARIALGSSLDDGDGINTTNVGGDEDLEIYYAITFRSADLTAGSESITFRLLSGGATFDSLGAGSYDITPTATAPAASGTINTVTIDTGQSAVVTDNSTELRHRTRQQADSLIATDLPPIATYTGSSVINTVTITGVNNYAAVTDNDISYRVAQRVPVETVKVEDLLVTTRPLDHYSRATRYRTRQQTDSHTVTDPAPTATYVPGQTVNTVTILGINNYAAVADSVLMLRERTRQQADAATATDQSLQLRERTRQQSDSATATDNSLESRLRDRGQSDAITVEDVNAQLRESNNEIIETIDPADDSIELRNRSRLLADSIVVSDPAPIATYIPPGAVTYNRTLQDLDSVTVIDNHIELRLRDRQDLSAIVLTDQALIPTIGTILFDSITVTDDAIELRERNRAQADAIDVVDRIGGPIISTILTDSIDVVDNHVELRLRDRETLDTSVILDNADPTYIPPGSVTYNRTLQDLDSVTVVDNHLELRFRVRLNTDAIPVTDPAPIATYVPVGSVINNVTLQDLNSVSVMDDAIGLRERNRVELDSADVTDSIGSPTISTILSDSAAVADSALPERVRPRQQSDSLDVSETVESVRERLRTLSDSIDVSDSSIATVDSGINTVTVTETLSVLDSIIATNTVDAGSFFAMHGVESLLVDHGLEAFHINHGLREETS